MSEITTNINQEENDIDTGFNGIDGKLMPPLSAISIVLLDEQMANRHKKINVYEKQRPLKTRRLEELKRKVNDGRFHGGEVAVAKLSFPYPVVATDENGKKITNNYFELLMNGQHQCELVIQTGKPQKTVLKEFKVDKKEQLPVLFAQFDQPGGNRTIAQVAQAYSDDIPWSDKKATPLISGAIAWLVMSKHKKSAMTIDERIQEMLKPQWWSHADWVYNTLFFSNSRKDYPHIQRQPVVVAMLKHHKKHSIKAEEFWSNIKTGVNNGADSPELILREWLTKIVLGGGGKFGKKSVGAEEVIIKCDKAFDAFVAGETLTKLQMPRRDKKKKK